MAPKDRSDELAELLAGQGSSIRGFTHARVLRGIAQRTGRGVRRELADALDISAATVSKATGDQIKLGLVSTSDDRSETPGMGRPQTPLALTRNFAVIGIAVVAQGGEPRKLLGKVAALDGTPFPGFEKAHQADIDDNERNDERCLVEALKTFAKQLAAEDNYPSAELLGCGITISGHVDNDRGVITRAFQTQWGKTRRDEPVKLQQEIEEHIGVPVSLENDVSSLAVRNNLRPLKESPARNYGVLAAIDEGVGGAVVVDSVTWPGAHGMAGEPGHIPAPYGLSGHDRVEDQGSPHDEERSSPDTVGATLKVPRCQCSQLGHVEAFASPRAIERRAVDNKLAHEGISIGELSARSRSDENTSALFYQGGVALGCAAVSLINWFDPAKILVYVPTELYETNKWLAGSRYAEGFRHEIERSSFLGGAAEKVLEINPTNESVMNERLASAAGYLVLRRLIRRLQSKRTSR